MPSTQTTVRRSQNATWASTAETVHSSSIDWVSCSSGSPSAYVRSSTNAVLLDSLNEFGMGVSCDSGERVLQFLQVLQAMLGPIQGENPQAKPSLCSFLIEPRDFAVHFLTSFEHFRDRLAGRNPPP